MNDETTEELLGLLRSIDRKLDAVAAAIVAAKVDEGERADLDMFLDDVRDAGAAIAERRHDDEAWESIERREGGERGGSACAG